MAKYFWNGEKWVPAPPKVRRQSVFPSIMRDTPGYLSPLGTGWIEGRAARREDLKRGGCVEAGDRMPQEFHNEKYAARQHAIAKAKS